MADRPEMFGNNRGFSGTADSMEPCKMSSGRPFVAMATKLGLGAEIPTPTVLFFCLFVCWLVCSGIRRGRCTRLTEVAPYEYSSSILNRTHSRENNVCSILWQNMWACYFLQRFDIVGWETGRDLAVEEYTILPNQVPTVYYWISA